MPSAPHANGRVAFGPAAGGIASGLGYSLWYAAVPSLGATRAAVVQLSVPVITAIAAVFVLGEPLRNYVARSAQNRFHPAAIDIVEKIFQPSEVELSRCGLRILST